jgi:hypothetical protein
MNASNSMMQFLLHALVPLLLSLNASAQADYYIGDTIELNTIGNQSADHAAIAVNHFGDVIIANHTGVNSMQKAVELNALAPLGETRSSGYKLFNTRRLGDPTLNIFGVGNDSCSKPDVESMGGGSFLVVWSRHDLSGNQPSRVEACKIITRDIHGSLLPQVQILSTRTGEGILLDDTSNSGEAGFMPDIASYKGPGANKAIVVFAHEQSAYTSYANTFRDYDLRGKKVHWPLGSSSPTLGQLVTLETNIPIDNANTSPYFGGLVLPDAVIDDAGALAIVYESYLIAPHQWYFGSPKGSIQLRRYSPNLSPLDEISFDGHALERHQRRPMIATSDKDATNMLTLGWNDIDMNGSGAHRAHFRAVTFNGNTSGYTIPQVIPWDESFGNKDDLATVAMSGQSRLVMTTRTLSNRKSLNGAFKSTQLPTTTIDFVPNSNHPWRPAMSIYDLPDSRSITYLSFEGPATSDPSLYRIHLTIQRLQ